VRRSNRTTWHCRGCGAEVIVSRRHPPVVTRVIEPGDQQTRVVMVKDTIVHLCRVGPSILDGQLRLALV
jgi:hypothetical protein